MHQARQIRHLDHSPQAQGLQRISCEFSLANVGQYLAGAIVGTHAAKGHVICIAPVVERSKGVLFAQRGAQNWRCGNADVRQTLLGPVSAVEEDALVQIATVVVLPVYQCVGPAVGRLRSVDANLAGDFHLVSPGRQSFAHHGHNRASVHAVGGGVQARAERCLPWLSGQNGPLGAVAKVKIQVGGGPRRHERARTLAVPSLGADEVKHPIARQNAHRVRTPVQHGSHLVGVVQNALAVIRPGWRQLPLGHFGAVQAQLRLHSASPADLHGSKET